MTGICRDFSHLHGVRAGSGFTKTPAQRAPCAFPVGKEAGAWSQPLTPSMPSLRMSLPVLPHNSFHMAAYNFVQTKV